MNALSLRTVEDAEPTPGVRDLLGYERECRSVGPKERAIRERFGFSAIRYQQLLNRVIDLPEALAYDPVLVHRLRRLRQVRREQRSALGLGPGTGSG